jgi:hypothetical protein
MLLNQFHPLPILRTHFLKIYSNIFIPSPFALPGGFTITAMYAFFVSDRGATKLA